MRLLKLYACTPRNMMEETSFPKAVVFVERGLWEDIALLDPR